MIRLYKDIRRNIYNRMVPCVMMLLATLAASVSSFSVNVRDVCVDSTFYDIQTNRCTPCSDCPTDNVVRELCWGDTDTVCGPFYEFKGFLNEVPSSDVVSTDASNEERWISRDDTTWYTLSVALLVALSVTSMVLVVLLGTVFLAHLRNGRLTSHGTEDGESAVEPADHDIYTNVEKVALVTDT